MYCGTVVTSPALKMSWKNKKSTARKPTINETSKNRLMCSILRCELTLVGTPERPCRSCTRHAVSPRTQACMASVRTTHNPESRGFKSRPGPFLYPPGVAVVGV
jgi:hypothetical protein